MGLLRQILRSWNSPQKCGHGSRRALRPTARRQWSLEPLEERALLAGDMQASYGIFGYNSSTAQFSSIEFNGTDFVEQSSTQALQQAVLTHDWSDPIYGDFDGDGRDDIVARDHVTGDWRAIRFDGSTYNTSVIGNWNPASDYVDLQVGDFTGDGRVDVAARDVYGDWWAVRFNGQSFGNQFLGNWNREANWRYVVAADLDGDGTVDLVGQNAATGQWIATRNVDNQFDTQTITTWKPGATYLDVQASRLNGGASQCIVGRDSQSGQWLAIEYSDGAFQTTELGVWNPTGVWLGVTSLDTDGDGREEIVGWNSSDGAWWIVRGDAIISTKRIADWNPQSQFTDFASGDFNGDGRQEVAARDLYGDWWMLAFQNGGFRNRHLIYESQSVNWQVIGVADLDGDHRDDIVVRDPNAGGVRAIRYAGGGYATTALGTWDGQGTDVHALLADLDGDGAQDVVDWRQSDNSWWAILHTPTGFANQLIAQWSLHTFDPAALKLADIDGDGASQYVEFDSVTASWWTADPVHGQAAGTLLAAWNTQAAWSNILIADIDGNGSDDLVGRDSISGNWWAVRKSDGGYSSQLIGNWNPQQPFFDIGVLDVNGDGIVDLIGREEDGSWWATIYDGQRFYNQYVGWSNPQLPLSQVIAADLDADGRQELLVYNDATGNWWIVGLAATAEGMQYVGRWQPGHTIVDVQLAWSADRGKQIIGRDAATGEWLQLGFEENQYTVGSVAQWDPAMNWRYVRVGDLDGDGSDELLAQDAATAAWWATTIGPGNPPMQLIAQWNAADNYYDVAIGDIDGDGRDEIVGRSANTGELLLLELVGEAYQTRVVAQLDPGSDVHTAIGKLSPQSDSALRRLILSRTPELVSLLTTDRYEAARLILNWSANAANQAIDASLQVATDERIQSMTAAQMYYELFAPLNGAVVCGGFATFYDRVLKLFGFESLVIDFGDVTDGLTHMSVVVSLETTTGPRFFMFDPTFNFTWVDANSGQYLAIDEVLDALDSGQLQQVAMKSLPLSTRKWLADHPVDGGQFNLVQTTDSKYAYNLPGYSLQMYLDNFAAYLTALGYSQGISGFLELLETRVFSVRGSASPQVRDQFVALLQARGIPLGIG